jgi:hypothetical protein
VGTWGPGAFDNGDALDLLDTLAEQDAAQRRQALEQILCRPPDSLGDVSWREGCGEIVAAAAAAVVAAGRRPVRPSRRRSSGWATTRRRS